MKLAIYTEFHRLTNGHMIAVVVLKMEVCLAGIEEVAVCLPTTLFHRLEINNAKWKMKQFIFFKH